MFDLWINNSDRTSSDIGTGNINLLFDEATSQILIIDHNLAFADEVDFNEHIYSINNRNWQLNEADKKAFNQKALQLLENFEDIYQQIPGDWVPFEEDEYQKFEHYITEIKQTLNRIKQEDYWENIR